MNKIIKDINEKLQWCPCGQGCHLCSGTGYGFNSTLYNYFVVWFESPGNYETTFKNFIECGNIYKISDDIDKLCYNQYQNNKEVK